MCDEKSVTKTDTLRWGEPSDREPGENACAREMMDRLEVSSRMPGVAKHVSRRPMFD